MSQTMQTPPGEESIFQNIASVTGIHLSSDTIKGLTAPRCVSVGEEWASQMFLECNIPTCVHYIEYTFLYIDPSGRCVWLHKSGPSLPDAAELSDSLILCCRATGQDLDFVWVVDITLKCGVSIWHYPFLERQSMFAASVLPPFLKMLNFSPAQAVVKPEPRVVMKSHRGSGGGRGQGGSKRHPNCADSTVYMYRWESLFQPIKLQSMSPFRQLYQPQIQIATSKEFICTFRHPLLRLHQAGRLMPLIRRLCGSEVLREDLSGDAKEALHLYSYQKNGQGRGGADAELAKMFRGLILDKRVYPPKIVCLPLLAFETVEQGGISEARLLKSHNKQIFEVSVKMDGTSVVMACYQGRVVVATKNRFKSRRVDLVKAILNARRITESAFRENHTYICEYIGGPNCRVIKYPFEGLCLLTVIDNRTGIELDYESRRSMADSLGFITPATVNFTYTGSFDRVIDCFSEIYGPIEGVVVRTPDGKKFKIKSGEWEMGARALYSVSPMLSWASELKSISLWWSSIIDKEFSLTTEISEWLRRRARGLLKFQKHVSGLQLDPYAVYMATCYRFDVLQCRSAHRLHARIIRDSADHSTKLCSNISACSTCITVWFFLKPYNNRVCWETCSIPSRDRIRTVLEDDWHHIDTAQAPYVQWLGNSDVTDLVFQYMDHCDLSVCRRVCRHWHLFINQNFEDAISNSFNYIKSLDKGSESHSSQQNVGEYSPAYSYRDYSYRGYCSS